MREKEIFFVSEELLRTVSKEENSESDRKRKTRTEIR